jgi:uncharacterized membrane protein
MPQTAETYYPQINVSVNRLNLVIWGLTGLLVWLWIGLIIAAPILKEGGFMTAANWIYDPFSYLCHQISARSFHIHNQPFAVCARCFGVYFGLAFGVLIYPLFRSLNDLHPLPRILLLLSPVPTTIDFFLGYFGFWENTHSSRFLTGSVLGLGCAFFLVPGVVEISRFAFQKNRARN